jgi:hypothetical protein
MNYILPLIINSRRINYLDLKDRDIKEPESFIIELPQEDNAFTIFSIDKSKEIQTLIKNTGDIPLRHIHFSAAFDESEQLITIRLSASAKFVAPSTVEDEKSDWKNQAYNKPQNSAISQQSSFVSDEIRYSCDDGDSEFKISGNYVNEVADSSLKGDFIKCKFLFESNGKSYQNELHFHLAHASCFHHFGLDFGSESSQIKVSNYKRSGQYYLEKTKSKNLFEMVKDFKGITENNQKFLQYEHNTDFIKSNFFLKKILSDYNSADDTLSDEEDLKLLVHETELNSHLTNDFHQLSNLKLAHKHGDVLRFMNFQSKKGQRVVSLSLEELKHQAYSTILKSFIEATLQNVLDEDCINTFIRFSILVPNIYSIQEVATTKGVVNSIFHNLQKSPKYIDKIKAWEVVTISESDAAFLGYFDKGMNNIKPNSYYIIVDCGKGTTDFSIIQTGKNNSKEIKSLYRNGFAGAGNLITYAFFESMIKFVLETADPMYSDAARAFFRDLENRDKGNIITLAKNLEALKFQYSNKPNTPRAIVENQWNAIKNGDLTLKNFAKSDSFTLQDFNNMIKDIRCFYDWGNYIDKACTVIIKSVIDNIHKIDRSITCGGILLTGRGFLFKPLTEKLKGSLTSDLNLAADLIKMPDNPTKLKAVCLDGIFTSGYVMHPELVGFPIQISTKKVEPVVYKAKTKYSAIFDVFFKLSNMEDNYDESKNRYKIDKDNLDSLKFLIGNTLYNVKDGEFYNKNWVESVDLIFTKNGFYARNIANNNKIKGYSRLNENDTIDAVTLQYLIPSLFPAKIDVDYIQALKEDDDDNYLKTLMSLLPD